MWSRLGGQLGIGLCVVGFGVIFLGWNGAAGKDRLPSQFPFLISGGVVGLAIVLIGVGVMVIQAQRADRAVLESDLTDIRRALEVIAAAGTASNGHGSAGGAAQTVTTQATAEPSPGIEVVAGPTAYHRPDCRLLEGKEALPTMTVEAAEAQGLAPCRVCGGGVAEGAQAATSSGPVRRRRS